MSPELCLRREDDLDLAVLVWRFDAPVQVISSAPFGGGIATRSWVLNAQVRSDYRRTDPDTHVLETAADLHLGGEGAGMLTADAVVIACPDGHAGDSFGGPRSTWGARLARATHAAVLEGAR